MRTLRKILLPFSWLYGGVILLRNRFYDWGWLSSTGFEIPVICIGNLRVGGTGKTPMTEYLTRLLKDQFRLALLSRGYKRQSEGFILAGDETRVTDLGDEPFQFFRKFPEVAVAVDANRVEGIRKLQELVNPEVVLLDDAFQHRKVRAGLYVLLTVYNDLYVHDTVLPAGDLRDTRNQAARADIIVVTKCPNDLSAAEMDRIKGELSPKRGQEVCFATIDYDRYLYNANSERLALTEVPANATLVTGIATPDPLLEHLDEKGVHYKHEAYADHHHFTPKEIAHLEQLPFVFTTEKDFMRLENAVEGLYYLPIRVRFLGTSETRFQERLGHFLKAFD